MIVGATETEKRKTISVYNVGVFRLKKSKRRMFATKKISEWRKVIKTTRKLFRTYEKIHGI